jgi:uncharacterized protein YqgV (UPF0045/DUF77 family)
MRVSVEISLYPLADDYRPRIEAFIRELAAEKGIELLVNQMSTQLTGELRDVMGAVEAAVDRAFSHGTMQVLIAKILNADLPIKEPPVI